MEDLDIHFDEEEFWSNLKVIKKFTPEEWEKIEHEINTAMKNFSLEANAKNAATIKEASQIYLTD